MKFLLQLINLCLPTILICYIRYDTKIFQNTKYKITNNMKYFSKLLQIYCHISFLIFIKNIARHTHHVRNHYPFNKSNYSIMSVPIKAKRIAGWHEGIFDVSAALVNRLTRAAYCEKIVVALGCRVSRTFMTFRLL